MTRYERAVRMFSVFALAYLAFTIFSNFNPYSFVWNRTASIPEGIYLARERGNEPLVHGEYACFTYEVPQWAKSRRYFYEGFRLCKHVGALPGDTISIVNHRVTVTTPDGKTIDGGELVGKDSQNRPVPVDVLKPGVVPGGMVAMLAPAHANSLDSRYLGLVPADKVTHILTPVYTW